MRNMGGIWLSSRIRRELRERARARERLKDFCTFEKILAAIQSTFSVSPAEIEGSARREQVVFPRTLAIAAARACTNFTVEDLALLFNRGNSMIRHYVVTARNRVETNPRARAQYDQLLKSIAPAILISAFQLFSFSL